MSGAEQFPFVEVDSRVGEPSRLPYVPMTLSYQERSVSVLGLLDTGSAVKVLPYQVGLRLGAVWEQQTSSVRLTGTLANEPARVLLVHGTIAKFAPVRLAFAWTQTDAVPVILGQVNFFMDFDVCLYRSRSIFELSRAGA